MSEKIELYLKELNALAVLLCEFLFTVVTIKKLILIGLFANHYYDFGFFSFLI